MLIYFVTLLPFIFFYKYFLPIKQLPLWLNEVRVLSFQFLEDLSIILPSVKSLKNVLSTYFGSKIALKTKRKCYNKFNTNTMENIETNATRETSLLDLPDLALETILEKLEPAELFKMASVSTYLRDVCLSEHLWKEHMKRKWGRIFGFVAQKEWQLHVASQKDVIGAVETRGFFSKLWPIMMFYDRKSIQPPDTCSSVSCYRALETGRFWFPAQVFNRENGHVGFVMSCYDAELNYDSHTDTFEARYPPHGTRAVATESGVTWDRLRKVPVDNSPHDLHISTCLDDLRPKDNIEIQWRRNKQFPYGWWYGVIGHLESCDANDTYCRCHQSDMVMLEFKQYAPGSRWRHMTIKRKNHHEEGNEIYGFYGGIKKLYNKDEISMWQPFWPNDILE